jgi:hypothetical protein
VSAPALSVVVVRFAGGDAIRRSLDAICSQAVPGGCEVLAAYGPRHAPDEALRADGRVTWVAAPTDDPAVARSCAVRVARGSVIACTEDHCIPASDWCSCLLEAHGRCDAAVIGGAIEKTVPDSPHAWAAFLMEYGAFLPPLTEGPAERCSDCNVAYKRTALQAVADVWRDSFRETAVHAALRARGFQLWLDPRMLVSQSRAVEARELGRERREHGRVYGAQVAALRGLGNRLSMAARTPLIPLVFLARARRAVRERGRSGDVPAGTWRALAAVSAAWAIGECEGLLTGRAP